MEPKYNNITVQLTGQDGNIFNLMGITTKAMKRAGLSKEEIAEFLKEVQSSNSYDQALQVIMRWVNVE